MLLGRVVGTAVATIKYPGLEGSKLLVVQPLNKHLQSRGSLQVAVDTAYAGLGDLCFLVRSREASLALSTKGLPVDLAIIGIVDTVDLIADAEFVVRSGFTAFT